MENDRMEERSMRVSMHLLLLTIFAVTLMIGCNDGQYANPYSVPTTPSEWRSMTVTDAGASFSFPDIGAYLSFPAGAIPQDETHTFNIQLYPEGVPMVPPGRIYIRQGTFELIGTLDSFNETVEVRFQVVEEQNPGISLCGFRLNSENVWQVHMPSPMLDDGQHVTFRIRQSGVYGVFEFIPLHVEANVSRQMGPAPLSVGFEAIITGGHPPYIVIWEFGDNSDSEGGLTVAHGYPDPGDYTATVMVVDQDNTVVTDWVHLTCYWMPGPPALP